MNKVLIIGFLLLEATVAFAQTDSARLITVNRILIEGNQKTKPQIIARELSFQEGGQYHRYQLDSMFVWDRNRIYNTNLFNTVVFTLENERNGLANVLINVDERWYFYPIPIFRLIDRNFNDWWTNRNRDLSRVNLGLRLTQYNFRGRAEQLRIGSQFGFETRFNFTYRIPYIEKTQRHGLRLDFNYLEAKNLPYSTENNIRTFLESEELLRTVYISRIRYNFRNSFYSFHFLSFRHTSTNIADTVVALNPNYLGDENSNQKYLTLGYMYTWDKRNNRNYPTNGERYAGAIRKYGLKLYDDVDFMSASVRLSRYWPLGKNWFYAGNLIGFASFPEERGYFNYFAIGFIPDIIRGYDLNIVEGSSYVIQQNEIKKKIFSFEKDISSVMPIRQFQYFPVKLFGKVFFDHGYARGYPEYDGSSLLDDRYLYSIGLGLDLILVYDIVFSIRTLSKHTGRI